MIMAESGITPVDDDTAHNDEKLQKKAKELVRNIQGL
jgi:hypothetical protein